MTDWGITSADTFLEFASGLMSWTPSEDVGGKEIYSILCLFYFIFDQPAINDLQAMIDISSIGRPMTTLSQWMVAFAKNMGDFMNTKASLTPESYQTFVNSPYFNLDEAKLKDPNGPTGGFSTFNELFARKLKPGMRPVSCPDDDRVIVYPADSTFDGQWHIHPDGTVPINPDKIQMASFKNVPTRLIDLVGNSDYAGHYYNGKLTHSVLEGGGSVSYRRQHAPVSGTVVEVKVIPGLCYLNVEVQTDSQGDNILKPYRRWGKKKIDGDGNVSDAPDNAGYQFLQARGWYVIFSRCAYIEPFDKTREAINFPTIGPTLLVVSGKELKLEISIAIKNPTLGHVTVLPIGMGQVSSVVLCVRRGDKVVKGVTEISYFQFGGSDCVVLFEPKAKVNVFGAADPKTGKGQKYLVGEVLGYANPHHDRG
ncbi:MAG: hypothetical protein Q9167_006892 [Letrouitia subvulpina]